MFLINNVVIANADILRATEQLRVIAHHRAGEQFVFNGRVVLDQRVLNPAVSYGGPFTDANMGSDDASFDADMLSNEARREDNTFRDVG